MSHTSAAEVEDFVVCRACGTAMYEDSLQVPPSMEKRIASRKATTYHCPCGKTFLVQPAERKKAAFLRCVTCRRLLTEGRFEVPL